MAKIRHTHYLPREKELVVEFSDGVVYWYDNVNKRDLDEKIAEARRSHDELKKRRDLKF